MKKRHRLEILSTGEVNNRLPLVKRIVQDIRSVHRERKEKEKRTKAGLPGEDEAPLPPPVEPIHADKNVGRNDPCPCGSGKKYKKCCGKP